MEFNIEYWVLVSYGKKENNMRSNTIICVRWKLTGRLEVFVNLGKLYTRYSDVELGVSRWTLHKKNLEKSWQNDTVEIIKVNIN